MKLTKKSLKVGTTVYVPRTITVDGEITTHLCKGKIKRIRVEVRFDDGYETLVNPSLLAYSKEGTK